MTASDWGNNSDKKIKRGLSTEAICGKIGENSLIFLFFAMPLKEEELNTILILGGLVGLFIVPPIILYFFNAGPWEYVVAISIFVLIGMIFWHAGAVLRRD